MENKPPRIFVIFGEIVRQLRWLGYLTAIAVAGAMLYFLVMEFRHVYEKGIGYFFLVMFSWTYIGLGFASFTKNFGESIRRGRRSGVIGFIIISLLIVVLSKIVATIAEGQTNHVGYWLMTAICGIFSAFILIFAAGLVFYWENLESGTNIYDE